MVRTWLRRAAVMAPVIAMTAGLSVTPAAADGAADAPNAILSNTLQLSVDGTNNVNQSLKSDNLTCDLGDVYGGPVNQRTPYVVGEVYGQDFSVGELTCMSLETSKRYSVSVTVYIQAFNGSSWSNVASGSASMNAVAGAATAEAVALGQYGAFSSALNKYHRGYIVATTSTGRVYRFPTPTVWFMAA